VANLDICLQGALFDADYYGINNSFCPKSDLDIYFIRLMIYKLQWRGNVF